MLAWLDPTQLNATEQDTLVKQIGLSLLRAAPRDWRRVTVEYRAVGKYPELTGEVALADGTTQGTATHDIARPVRPVAHGHVPRGPRDVVQRPLPARPPVELQPRVRPGGAHWDLRRHPAYADELRMFPRTEENVPDWLMRRMAGLGPERPVHASHGPRLRRWVAVQHPVCEQAELDVERNRTNCSTTSTGSSWWCPDRLDLDRLPSPRSAVPSPSTATARGSGPQP